ncbi:MAG: hypothetical protein JZU64_16690, partial [Rhodoferax sp.]|nr:hypothetical protein [Rhodoferax sp.]
SSNLGGYLKKGTLPSSDQYRYETLVSDWPAELGCPRPKLVTATLEVNENIWLALTEDERNKVKAKGEVDVVPMREVGVITQSQKIDASTLGNNSGAALGEAVASTKYVDKSINDGTYSAQGQLGAQVKGALLGSLFNKSATSLFKLRYTVRLASGEIVSIDKNVKTNDFVVANGVCVTLPFVEQTSQTLCDTTLASFKEKHFGLIDKPTSQASQKEIKLRELKRLFDEGLLSESVYADQQTKILKTE